MLFFSLPAPEQIPGSARVLEDYITRIAKGDKAGLGELYEQTRTAVYGFALSICKNVPDAEEVLQDAFIQIYHMAERYTPQGKPMAWILRVTRNLALMRLREKGRTVALTPEDWQTQFADLTAVTPDDRLVLEAVLARLSDEERQIVTLHALSGLKHREIATILELPLPTVLSKYHRALKKLRNALKEEE